MAIPKGLLGTIQVVVERLGLLTARSATVALCLCLLGVERPSAQVPGVPEISLQVGSPGGVALEMRAAAYSHLYGALRWEGTVLIHKHRMGSAALTYFIYPAPLRVGAKAGFGFTKCVQTNIDESICSAARAWTPTAIGGLTIEHPLGDGWLGFTYDRRGTFGPRSLPTTRGVYLTISYPVT